MATLTEYQRKYLLRLSDSAIDHAEVARWGKRPVATMLSLRSRGLAGCTSFDGEGEVDPASTDDEFWWTITDAGLKAIGKA